jgi:hypothetical protein
MQVVDIIVFILVTSVFSQIGMITGSIFDRGNRNNGDMRKDLPSTIGFLIGFLIGVIFVI